MKKLMMAAAASTLLGACASQPTTGGESRAEDDSYVSVGSNIPRKKSQGASAAKTESAAELEHSRMNSSQ